MSTRRDQILEAARELLIEKGLQGVTMRKVALRVGVSATAIYRHYADKHAVLQAAVLESRESLMRNFRKALAAGTPRERLKETGLQYLRFAVNHPKEFQVLFMAWEQLPEGLPDARNAKGYTPTFQFLLERVEECIGAGLLPAGTNTIEVALLCWSVVHGLACMYLTGGTARRMSKVQFQTLATNVSELTIDCLVGVPRRRPTSRRSPRTAARQGR